MKLTVCLDRLEGDKAVLLAGEQQIIWPRALLPREASEGDILSLLLEIDSEATDKAKAQAAELLQELTKNS